MLSTVCSCPSLQERNTEKLVLLFSEFISESIDPSTRGEQHGLGKQTAFPSSISAPAQDGTPFSALLLSQNKAEGKLPQAKLSVGM